MKKVEEGGRATGTPLLAAVAVVEPVLLPAACCFLSVLLPACPTSAEGCETEEGGASPRPGAPELMRRWPRLRPAGAATDGRCCPIGGALLLAADAEKDAERWPEPEAADRAAEAAARPALEGKDDRFVVTFLSISLLFFFSK